MKIRNRSLKDTLTKSVLYGRMWLSLIWVQMRLSTIGYKSFERTPVQTATNKASIDPIHVSRIVSRVASFTPGALCLAQAIVAQRQSARFGYDTTIRVGVKSNSQAKLLAHAWLLYEAHVVLGGSNAELVEYDVIKEMNSATT